MIQLRVVKDDGSITYVGYIYRHWIINEDGIEVSYVGKTECKPTKRFGIGGKKHLGKDTKFERAIKKYGWDNFNHDIIYTAECETYDELHNALIELEKYFIAKYDSYYNGYNSTKGGQFMSEKLLSEETEQKRRNTREKNQSLKECCGTWSC